MTIDRAIAHIIVAEQDIGRELRQPEHRDGPATQRKRDLIKIESLLLRAKAKAMQLREPEHA